MEHDRLDITRQALSNHALVIYSELIDCLMLSELNCSKDKLISISDNFLELLTNLDRALSSIDAFSFDEWAAGAFRIQKRHGEPDSYGSSAAESALYAYNAHNLVTLWGPQGQISDYSSRLWSGLIERYYKQRWKIAIQAVTATERKSDAVQYDRLFSESLSAFEHSWQQESWEVGERFLSTNHGAPSVETLTREMFEKYAAVTTVKCASIGSIERMPG